MEKYNLLSVLKVLKGRIKKRVPSPKSRAWWPDSLPKNRIKGRSLFPGHPSGTSSLAAPERIPPRFRHGLLQGTARHIRTGPESLRCGAGIGTPPSLS